MQAIDSSGSIDIRIRNIDMNISAFKSRKQLLSQILPLLEKELQQDIIFDNLPYCILPNGLDHFSNKKDRRKIKDSRCVICRLNNICNGFYPCCNHLISPSKDLPGEIILEVTDRCNQQCGFCFNKIEYGLKDRNKRKEMSTAEIKSLIDKIDGFTVKFIRFSGGEPLLREDIFNLMGYAKSLGLKVWLNTNGTLVTTKNAGIISRHVSNILLPLNGYDDKSDYSVTKLKNSFKLKMSAIGLLRKVQVIRGGIVLTRQNVDNMEKFYLIAKNKGLSFIEFYRPITPVADKPSLKKAVSEIYRLNMKYNKNFKIANAIPFCFYKPKLTAKVSLGGIYDDGYSRMVISGQGKAKPSYYCRKEFGDAIKDTLYSIWSGKGMASLHNLEEIPKKCRTCNFILTCRAGSRSLAMANKSRRDPLMPDA